MTDAQKALQQIRQQRDNPHLPVPSTWNAQYQLRKYQRVGVSHLLAMSRFVLGHPTGSGKTVMGLYAWGVLRDKRKSRLIVVTPKSAVSQWVEECQKFMPEVPCIEVPPSEEAHGRAREKYYHGWIQSGLGAMLCLNWGQYVRDWEFFEESQDLWKEGTWAILDECQRVKNPKSKAYQVTKKLVEIAPRIHGFTATLIKNKAHDALNIFNLLCPGALSLAVFNKNYVVHGYKRVPLRTGKGGGRRLITVKVVEGYKDLDDFANRVSYLYLAPPEQELDLERPEVQVVSRRAVLSPLHQRIYDGAEQGLFIEGSENDSAAFRAALSHAQIAAASPEHFSGSVPPGSPAKSLLTMDLDFFGSPPYRLAQEKNAKLALLKDLIENELEEDPLIIYSPFATSIVHLCHALEGYNPVVITGSTSTADRDTARHSFQEGKTQIILITDAGGEALNLQRARHVIFYSLPWSIGQYMQVVGRARRYGSQYEYLGVWHLLMKDTVDELVESILQPKAEQFETLLHCKGEIRGFSESMPVEVARQMRKRRLTK